MPESEIIDHSNAVFRKTTFRVANKIAIGIPLLAILALVACLLVSNLDDSKKNEEMDPLNEAIVGKRMKREADVSDTVRKERDAVRLRAESEWHRIQPLYETRLRMEGSKDPRIRDLIALRENYVVDADDVRKLLIESDKWVRNAPREERLARHQLLADAKETSRKLALGQLISDKACGAKISVSQMDLYRKELASAIIDEGSDPRNFLLGGEAADAALQELLGRWRTRMSEISATPGAPEQFFGEAAANQRINATLADFFEIQTWGFVSPQTRELSQKLQSQETLILSNINY